VLAAHKVIDVIGLSGVPAHPAGPGDLSRLPHVESREHSMAAGSVTITRDNERLAAATAANLAARPGSDSTRSRAAGNAAKSWSAPTSPSRELQTRGRARRAGVRWHRRRVLSRRLRPRRPLTFHVSPCAVPATGSISAVGSLRIALCQLDVTVGDLDGNADKVISYLARPSRGRIPGGVPRARAHRLPAGGSPARARLCRGQLSRAREGRGRDPALCSRRRLRGGGRRSLQRGGRVCRGRGARGRPQAAAPQLRGLRRTPLLRARRRQGPSLLDRRGPRRGDGVRGRLEPFGPVGRLGTGAQSSS